MTKSEAMKLMEFFNHGYTIFIGGHGYVDGPVESIDLSDDEDDIVYSSEVFHDRSLLDATVDCVKVYQRIRNWTEITPNLQEIH